jgi:hypothetical protein
MIRRNLILAGAVATAVGSSPSIRAEVDINSTTPVPVVIASEATSPVNLTISSPTAITALSAKAKIGRNIAAAAGTEPGTVYVRFQLSRGAKFASVPTLEVDADNANSAQVVASLSSGGNGSEYVIFDIKNADTTSPVTSEGLAKLVVGAVTVPDPNDIVRITYSTYGTAMQAANANSPTHTASTDYIAFKAGFSFSVVPNTITADVESDFLNFTSGNEYGSLASVSFATDENARLPTTPGGTIPNISDYLPAKANGFKILGDFSFLADANGAYNPASLFLIEGTGSADCSKNYVDEVASGIAMTTSSLSATEATIDIKAIGKPNKTYQLCIKRDINSTTQFKPSEYTMDFSPGASGNNVSVSERAGLPSGRIARDGTVLDAPFFTLAPGYISRIMLTNFGTRDANFTINLQSDEGNVPTLNTASTLYKVDTEGKGTLSGTIKAGTMLQINATDLVTSFSTKTRGSAKFTIVAPPQNIEGIYQAVNQGTGEVSNLHLIHEGGAAEVK